MHLKLLEMHFVLEVNALAGLYAKLKFALDDVRKKKILSGRLNKQLIISSDQTIFLYIFSPCFYFAFNSSTNLFLLDFKKYNSTYVSQL